MSFKIPLPYKAKMIITTKMAEYYMH